MCFVVLRASGRGGRVGRRDFGPCLTLVGVAICLVAGGWFEACVVVVVDCVGFPRRRRVTGINAEVAEAYEIGALFNA